MARGGIHSSESFSPHFPRPGFCSQINTSKLCSGLKRYGPFSGNHGKVCQTPSLPLSRSDGPENYPQPASLRRGRERGRLSPNTQQFPGPPQVPLYFLLPQTRVLQPRRRVPEEHPAHTAPWPGAFPQQPLEHDSPACLLQKDPEVHRPKPLR